MNGAATSPDRTSPRTTASGALTIFLPLFAVLLWWAFENRVEHTPAGQILTDGALRAPTAIVAAALAAGGPSVVLSLFLAARRRLRTMLRRKRGRVATAIALALSTPIAALGWLPVVFGFFAVIALASGPWYFWLFVPGFFVVATLTWYVAISLTVAGVRHHGMRIAVVALVWWSVYGIGLLAFGYQSAAY